MQTPEVIFENNEFIVLNKPAGWFSIPAREPKSIDQVLTSWLQTKLGHEPWVIHRLDRFTSGIILFAKNKDSHQQANLWFQNREIKKVYQFLAAPPPSMPAVQIKEPVDGKPSQTLFEVVKKNDLAFWGRAIPLTGRFHQIRAHAQFAGFPILGDQKYGGKKELIRGEETILFPRFCLHAFELQLPFGKFQAPLPKDFFDLKEKLFS